MNAYPRIGTKIWLLFKRRTYVDVVPATVTGVDWLTGEVVLRMRQLDEEISLKRKPGAFWATKEAAEKARDRICGKRKPWDSIEGQQLRFSAK